MTNLLQTICNITQWIDANTLAFIGIIVTIISISVTIWSIIANRNKKKQQPSQGEQNVPIILHAGIPEELKRQYLLENKIYIQPYIIHNGGTSKQLLHDFFIKKVFTKESTEPNDVYIIFGDTGTGKTAALVHLFDDYATQYKQGEHPYPNIKFFSLRDTTLETISNLPDKENTILLLDALDETPAAQDPTLFLQFQEGLQALFHGFARVVITCRPQLFTDQEAVSAATHTKIRTSTGWLQCTELFLAPFDNWQINQYLNQVFPLYKNYKKRRTARKIVKKHAYIAIRPLVLTYIKDIVESKRDINTALDLYDIIIEKTLQRDLEKINPNPTEEQIQQWWDITSDVAGYMYRNKKLSITNQELDSIPSVTKEPQFKQRSMLTRTGDEFHFPHKSFYEYFMAYRFLLYPKEIQKGTLYSMDFALQCYDELLAAISSQHPVRFANLESLSVQDIAGSLNNIGMCLDKLNHFSEAEPKYKSALEMFRQLEEQHPGQFKDDVAMTLNNLAILHRKTNNYPAAEKEYTEALKTYRDLAENNPDAFLTDVAMMLNNLGDIHRITNNHPAAETELNEALKIYRDLADKKPNILPNVAMTLNNLADLHNHPATEKDFTEGFTPPSIISKKNPEILLQQFSAIRKEFTEASKIRHFFSEKKLDSLLSFETMTLNNLAILHYDTNNYPAAEEKYIEALKIYRDLADKKNDAFLPYEATTLNNLAILHKNSNNYPAAEKEYTEALRIYRDLAKKDPDAFLPNVARILYNSALLYLNKEEKDIPAAEAAALESLEKYKIMAEKSHAAFDPYVKKAEGLLDEIQRIKLTKELLDEL